MSIATEAHRRKSARRASEAADRLRRERERRIREVWREGMTARELGDRTGYHHRTIRKFAKDLELPLAPQPARRIAKDDEPTDADLALSRLPWSGAAIREALG